MILFLEKLLFSTNPDSNISNIDGYITNQERGFAFALLKYAFGDEEAGQVFNELEVKKAYAIGSLILNKSYFMPDSEIETIERNKFFDINTLSNTYERKTVISSEYTLTDAELFKNIFRKKL